MAKKNITLNCKRENFLEIKELATEVELSITNFGSAPGSESLTIVVTGNHNTSRMFVALLMQTGVAWVKKDKKVQTPSKV